MRPDRAEGWFRLGECAIAADDEGLARSYFETAVGAEPGHELGWIGLLRLARKQGDAKRERLFLQMTQKIAPGHSEAKAKGPPVTRVP